MCQQNKHFSFMFASMEITDCICSSDRNVGTQKTMDLRMGSSWVYRVLAQTSWKGSSCCSGTRLECVGVCGWKGSVRATPCASLAWRPGKTGEK